MSTMTLDHPQYPDFLERLSGPEGIDLKDEGGVKWNCEHGKTTTHTEAILRAMGLSDDAITSSLAYFQARGGFCDCEIVFNVGDDNGGLA